MSVRALLLDDQSRSYEFRHEPRFGEARTTRPPRPPGPRVVDVRISGTPGFPEPEVRKRLRLTRGDRFDFAKWQRDRDRLEELYRSRGFYEARIRARRIADGDGVVLEYVIDRGPETRIEVRGWTLPDDVRARIVQRWSAALFDGFLERDATTIVRDHLAREGSLAPTITATVRRAAGEGVATLDLAVDPGPMVPSRLEFTGNDGITEARLYEAARTVGTLTAWLDAPGFARVIESLYHDEGFLSAEVHVAPPEVSRGTSVVRVDVREGPRFLIGDVGLTGADALADKGLREALGIAAGSPYSASAVTEALGRVDGHLRQSGFLASRTTVDAIVLPEASQVDLRVTVEPGPQSILRSVIVEGADPEKPLVARAITLTPGAPVDRRALGDTRRQLFDSGVFRGVEIDLQPVAADAPSSTAPVDATTQLVDAHIRLLERPKYRLRYGFAYNDDVVAQDVREQSVGLAADFERRNLFGGGGNAGVAARLRRDQQIGRVFLGANRFFGTPLRSTVFLERSRTEFNPESEFASVATVTDLSLEQAYSIRRRLEVRYGYAYGQSRTVSRNQSENEGIDVAVRAARLTTSALVDRRTDPFDPAGGWFASSNLELSRPSLGSDLSFLKGFLQFYQFQPVRRGMVLASAVRMGLARTYDDQDLYVRERFFAGGATSVRGYRQDDLGPRSILGDAAGGAALLVFNEELRFPVYRWLRGVGFVDLGNVYDSVGEISLGDLQVGVGAGVRLDTPVGLFRVDFGVPANPRPFDPKWKIHFGLGHAF
jgi:outer membrane protein insertion porin family